MQNQQPPAPITVYLAPQQVDVAPGSSFAEMTVSVRNMGQAVDQFGIEIEGLDPTWYTLDTQSLSLFPGDSIDAILRVVLPQGAAPTVGSYPFTVRVRSRSNPQIAGAAQGLVRVGAGQRQRAATSTKRTMWPIFVALGVVLALILGVGYMVLAGSQPSGNGSVTPVVQGTPIVAQASAPLPTSTLRPPATATTAATSTPLPEPTAVCGGWYIEHRGMQDTQFPIGISKAGPYQIGGRTYTYRSNYFSVIFVDATGVISSVRVANLDLFKGGHQQTEAIVGVLVSNNNVRVPLFTWTCDPGALVSLHANLDDNAKDPIPYSCSENMAGIYKPDGGSFATLKGQPARGNWVLEMSVYSNEERPTSYFNSWGLEMCTK